MQTDLDIPAKLRARRKELKLTMQFVADQSNLSVGFISQIERGLTVPSLTSLMSIASVLTLDVSDLVEIKRPRVGGVSLAGERDAFNIANGDVMYEPLSSGNDSLTMSGLITHLPVGFKFEGKDTHQGEELFYVLSGKVKLTLDGRDTVLSNGDAAHYSSELSHHIENLGLVPATLLWVGTMKLFGSKQGPLMEDHKDRMTRKINIGEDE